jgi:hypothetical protein
VRAAFNAAVDVANRHPHGAEVAQRVQARPEGSPSQQRRELEVHRARRRPPPGDEAPIDFGEMG